MKINVRKTKQLLKEKYNNNISEMARELGVERSHLSKTIKNGGQGAGGILCGAIIRYCDNNNLDFREYIFLE